MGTNCEQSHGQRVRYAIDHYNCDSKHGPFVQGYSLLVDMLLIDVNEECIERLSTEKY